MLRPSITRDAMERLFSACKTTRARAAAAAAYPGGRVAGMPCRRRGVKGGSGTAACGKGTATRRDRRPDRAGMP
jgi:hypothetical protein